MVLTRRCDNFGVWYCFQAFPRWGCSIQRTPGDEGMVENRNKKYITGCADVGGVLSEGCVFSCVLHGTRNLPGIYLVPGTLVCVMSADRRHRYHTPIKYIRAYTKPLGFTRVSSNLMVDANMKPPTTAVVVSKGPEGVLALTRCRGL